MFSEKITIETNNLVNTKILSSWFRKSLKTLREILSTLFFIFETESHPVTQAGVQRCDLSLPQPLPPSFK